MKHRKLLRLLDDAVWAIQLGLRLTALFMLIASAAPIAFPVIPH